MQETLQSKISRDGVVVTVVGHVVQELDHQTAVQDLKGGYVRIGEDVGDAPQHFTTFITLGKEKYRQQICQGIGQLSRVKMLLV